MRARHRHFNPRFAGADLVLDSRYINQSDNTAVSSWSDRSGNGFDATQANATNQPTFQTGEQGGCGGVDFDGSNDFMVGTYNPTAVPRTVHSVFKSDVTDARNIFQVPQTPNQNSWNARWGLFSGNFFISGDGTTTNQRLSVTPSGATSAKIGSWSSDSSRNVSITVDGATQTVLDNPPVATSTPTTNGYRLGEIGYTGASSIQQWNGLIFSVHSWQNEQIAAPIRKRCEHASAYSFKIACS